MNAEQIVGWESWIAFVLGFVFGLVNESYEVRSRYRSSLVLRKFFFFLSFHWLVFPISLLVWIFYLSFKIRLLWNSSDTWSELTFYLEFFLISFYWLEPLILILFFHYLRISSFTIVSTPAWGKKIIKNLERIQSFHKVHSTS